MNNISMVESKLPPGFRFHPRDEELVCDYLMNKATPSISRCPLMIEVDLNKCEPWEIPETACVGGKEWYFYSQRDRKYATGLRTNRATASGYWKATGKDRPVLRKGQGLVVGMRKTLVFYQGRAPKGRKSNWVMHEFRLQPPFHQPLDWVLCRVLYKNRGAAPKPTMGSHCCDDDTGISTIPLLKDSFDQTQTHRNGPEQQVPCFSNFSQSQQNPIAIPPINYGAEPNSSHDGGQPNTNACLGHFSCDSKELRVLLNQLSGMDNSVASLKRSTCLGGGGGSSESCSSYLN